MVIRRYVAALGLLCAFHGCLVGPNYRPPETQTPAGWSGGVATTRPGVPATRPAELAEWWISLEDDELNSLLARCVLANPDLQLAEARIREARALRDIAGADFWPQLNLGGGYTYRRSSQSTTPRTSNNNGLGQRLLRSTLQQIRILPGGINGTTGAFTAPSISAGPAGSGITTGAGGNAVSLSSFLPSTTSSGIRRDSNLYQLGFDASWELDLFGQIRRSVEATEADLAALDEARRDVLVTLFSEVARNYTELRGAQRRLTIALENIDVQQDTLEVSEARFKAGFTTELDVAQARSQLETTRSQIPLFETAIRQSIYQISVLLGQPPATLLDELSPQRAIPGVAPEVPIGLPSELLRRRPDIRQAERQLAAATARIGVATADLFPKVSLTGSFGTQSADMRRFLDARSLFWSVGPSVQWPLLDGGRIRANIRAEEAREAQALATYARTVLVAFQDVESALIAYNQEHTRRLTLILAVQASQRATELSNDLYNRGLGSFLDVLVSERSLYAAQDQLVLSETAVATNLIALYKALGGGWEKIPAVTTSRPSSAPG